MRKALAGVMSGLVLTAAVLLAVQPQKIELNSLQEFLKGTFHGISVSEDGTLSLSPKEDGFEGPPEEFYLSILVTGEGVIYLGTGHSGRIYRIDREGKYDLHYQVPEMDVYCLAQDRRGNLYAGTSPNGKIYRITGKNNGEIFFDPQKKYIWDLLFTEQGSLLAAVGESGGIYEISDQGNGGMILEAEENHILCMRKGPDDILYAGSGGKGRLYRIRKGKKPDVLYESPHEEIKSLTLDSKGNIYVASGGASAKSSSKPPATAVQNPVVAGTDVTVTVTPQTASISSSAPVSQSSQPGSLVKIGPDGTAKKLWQSQQDLIYSVFWDQASDELVFGTGNRGRIFTLDKKEKISLLHQKDSEQAYLLYSMDSKIYVLANNPSSLSVLLPEQRAEGEYLSRVFDTKMNSSWGRLEWEAEVPSGTTLQLQSRSGNSSDPNRTWSDWSPPYQKPEGELILSPKSRYVQLKIIFKSKFGNNSPQVKKARFFYIQNNTAPLISKVELLSPNTVFIKPLDQDEKIMGIDPDMSELARAKEENRGYVVAKQVERKGYQTVKWEAADENGDSLLYTISIREEREAKWRVMKAEWADKIFAFDTLDFPDGNYMLKIEASDVPSNPLGSELRTARESRPLVIDNSLPVIKGFSASRGKGVLNVVFEVQDAYSFIKEVKFLIRPHSWRVLSPVDGMCDYRIERFEVSLPLPADSDNMVMLKAIDSQGNVGIYRHIF